jgi:glyoxylase-like metal-dependent hydrolase (beta-lactamase superfamily II)
MMKIISLFVVGLLGLSPVFSAEYPASQVEMRLEQVSPHVYYVRGKAGIATDNEGFISNAAAIVSDQGVVLVDALGSPSLAVRFLALLRELTDQPIVKLIITHYHADHIYGAQVFKDLGAEIIAPAGFREYLESDMAVNRLQERRVSLYPWVNEDTRLVAPDQVIDADTRIALGALTLQLNYLGAAHSDGDLSVLVEPDKVLISGDIIFEGRVPFTGGADTAHWLDVLERLDNAGIEALIPGHGPAASDPRQAVRLTLDYLRYTRDKMAEGVDEMTPFAEIYEATDWSRFETLPAFAESHRRNAYGVYLSLEKAMLAE